MDQGPSRRQTLSLCGLACARGVKGVAEALREGAVTGGDRKREGACRDNIGRVLFPRG